MGVEDSGLSLVLGVQCASGPPYAWPAPLSPKDAEPGEGLIPGRASDGSGTVSDLVKTEEEAEAEAEAEAAAGSGASPAAVVTYGAVSEREEGAADDCDLCTCGATGG